MKLTREIEESASDDIGYGTVFHPTSSPRDKVWRATLSFLSRPAECVMQVGDASFDEKVGVTLTSL